MGLKGGMQRKQEEASGYSGYSSYFGYSGYSSYSSYSMPAHQQVVRLAFRVLGSGTELLKTFSPSLSSAPKHTYVLSHRGPIQAGAEKLGICGSVRGMLGTLGRGTLARLLVKDLKGRSQRQSGRNVGRITHREREEIFTHTHTHENNSNHLFTLQ